MSWLVSVANELFSLGFLPRREILLCCTQGHAFFTSIWIIGHTSLILKSIWVLFCFLYLHFDYLKVLLYNLKCVNQWKEKNNNTSDSARLNLLHTYCVY